MNRGVKRIASERELIDGLAEFCEWQAAYFSDRILNLALPKNADDIVESSIERAELTGHSKAYRALVQELRKASER